MDLTNKALEKIKKIRTTNNYNLIIAHCICSMLYCLDLINDSVEYHIICKKIKKKGDSIWMGNGS